MIMDYKQRALCITMAAFVIINLSACVPGRPVVTLPPVALTQCEAEPSAPTIPSRDGTEETLNIRDQMTLAYILAMRSAWGDCYSKVQGMKAWAQSLQ